MFQDELEEEENDVSRQSLKKKSRDFIKKCTQVDLSDDSIIPISAHWSSKSYRLMKNPEDSTLKNNAIGILEKSTKDQPHGQGGFQASSPKELAYQVDVASGLRQLKQRLVEHQTLFIVKNMPKVQTLVTSLVLSTSLVLCKCSHLFLSLEMLIESVKCFLFCTNHKFFLDKRSQQSTFNFG